MNRNQHRDKADNDYNERFAEIDVWEDEHFAEMDAWDGEDDQDHQLFSPFTRLIIFLIVLLFVSMAFMVGVYYF